MQHKSIEQSQAAVNMFADDSAFTLSDAELLAIHGGSSPYGPTELRQDLSTIGSATSLGNVIVPGGIGAAAGAGLGMGIVAEHRFNVVDNVTSAVGHLAHSIASNEETHRSNII